MDVLGEDGARKRSWESKSAFFRSHMVKGWKEKKLHPAEQERADRKEVEIYISLNEYALCALRKRTRWTKAAHYLESGLGEVEETMPSFSQWDYLTGRVVGFQKVENGEMFQIFTGRNIYQSHDENQR